MLRQGTLALAIVAGTAAGGVALETGEPDRASPSARPAPGRIETAKVLETLARGRRVVFVDAREPAEYREGHIPGAINLPLRRAHAAPLPPPLRGADLVVPYCLKDFRGYEVAKALVRRGVANVRVMQPSGLKGWRSLGLPVARGPAPGSLAPAGLAQRREGP